MPSRHVDEAEKTRPPSSHYIVRLARASLAFGVFTALLWPPYYAATTHGWATTFRELRAVPIVCAFLGAAAAWAGRPIERHLFVLGLAIVGLLMWEARGFAESMVAPGRSMLVVAVITFAPIFLLGEWLNGLAEGLGLGRGPRLATWRRLVNAAAWGLGVGVFLGAAVLLLKRPADGTIVVPDMFWSRLIQVFVAVGISSLIGGLAGQSSGVFCGRQMIPATSVVRRLMRSRLFYAFVSGYLLLGVIFAGICWGLWSWDQGEYYIDPKADRPSYLGFLYYSFVTLSTTGYGDIRPVHLLARGLACLEMMAGLVWVVLAIGELVQVMRGNSPAITDSHG